MCLGLKHPPALSTETAIWLLFGFMMLGAAMHNAIAVLFTRADFDLLLSAPISPRAILLARLAGIAVGAALSGAFFLIPVINGWTIGLGVRYAWGYLVWLLLAATMGSISVWLTLLLVRWLGPRRARTWSQVLAACLGASIYIGFQAQNFMPQEFRDGFGNVVATVFAHPVPATIPRAAQGEAPALLALVFVAGAFIAITARLLSRMFTTGIQEAGGIKPPTRTVAGHYRFAAGLGRATFRKDLRLIARDPLLLSKVLPTVFYLVPILFSIGKFGNAGVVGALAPFAVLIAISIASTLVSVAASGEEGWDLIRLSPASTLSLRVAKIAAGSVLPIAACALIAIAIAVLGRPLLGLFSLVMSALCAGSLGWLEVATIKPTTRSDLVQRGGRSGGVSAERLVFGAIFMIAGVGGVVAAAYDSLMLAVIGFVVTVGAALLCFFTVKLKDIEFEATPRPA
jgi:ABC-2 type transport system permease protein